MRMMARGLFFYQDYLRHLDSLRYKSGNGVDRAVYTEMCGITVTWVKDKQKGNNKNY